MKMDYRAVETETILARLADSLRKSIAEHQRMLDQLLQSQVELPVELRLELGVLLEDASNLYMSMSERVSRKS